MRPRAIVIFTILCTAGVFSLTDLIQVRAQTALEAEGPGINATGTGTAGRIVKWLTATRQGNSVLFESAGKIGLGTTTPAAKLTVSGAGAYNVANAARFDLFNTVAGAGFLQHVLDNGMWQIATTSGLTRMVINSWVMWASGRRTRSSSWMS